jgi:hypothetical protein
MTNLGLQKNKIKGAKQMVKVAGWMSNPMRVIAKP